MVYNPEGPTEITDPGYAPDNSAATNPTDPAAGGDFQAKLRALLATVDKNNWSAGLLAIEPQLNALGVQLQKDSSEAVRGRLLGSAFPNGSYDPFAEYGWVTAPQSGAGSMSYEDLTTPFGRTYQAPADLNLGGTKGLSYIPDVPEFRFKAPTIEEAMNDPGYQFGLNQSLDAMQHSAAARGTLTDSGTVKSLGDYARNAATQQYNQVYGRRLGEAQSEFAPVMTGWSTLASAGQRQNELNNANAWQQFLQSWAQWKDQRDSSFDKRFQVLTA